MIPKVTRGIRSSREHLRRLAVVFKVEIRLKIVIELYIRPMSPTDFYEKFGGGSVSRVAQHFAVLERHGWLRRVGLKDREGRRRGRSETLYRATETAYFDTETWALLPYSLRLAYSWSMIKLVGGAVRESIEGVLSEQRSSRDLSCIALTVDSLGWERIIAKLGAHFESIFEEQDDAKIRVARGGGELSRVGVLQMGFEASRSDDRFSIGLVDGSAEPPMPFPERVAPIFADDLAIEILAMLNDREMSVTQFHREFGSDISEWAIRYRFARLLELAWIAVVDEVKRRGVYEKIYRATKPIVVDNGPWANVPDALERTENWAALAQLSRLAKESIVAGTFDVRYDRDVCWSVVHLDRRGWENIVAALNVLEAVVRKEEEQAKERITAGAEPLTMVVALGALESPVGQAKAP